MKITIHRADKTGKVCEFCQQQSNTKFKSKEYFGHINLPVAGVDVFYRIGTHNKDALCNGIAATEFSQKTLEGFKYHE